MATAGDILEQPETGWTRYELSSYPINEYPQINVFEEGDFRIETPGNPEDKIKIGSKIRVFGKIANPISGNQADSLMDILIGPYPYAAQTTYPVMPLTDNKYTLLADIELTAVHFLSTFIRFRGNREYGYNQALFSAIDIFEEVNATPPSFNSATIGTITQTTAKLNVNLNENGKVYYKLELSSDNFTITSDSIKRENNYFDATAGITSIKEINLYHGQQLAPNTAYDLFIVAEDTAGNLQVESTKIQFQTLVETIKSNLPSGTHKGIQLLELSYATEGSEIRYLAYNKGEEPAIEDVDMSYVYNLYTEPLEISGELVLYAQAWKDGVAISEVTAFEYNILEETEEEKPMEQIYFGDDDIKVKITSEKAYMGGNLNKVLVATNEAVIPLGVFAGNGGYEAVRAYLVANSLVAPKLLAAVKTLLTQVDNNGNEIVPEYFYIMGNTDVATLVTNLASAADICDYYGIVPVFQNDAFVTQLLSDVLTPKHRIVILSDTSKTLSYTTLSERITAIHDALGDYKNAAEAGRILQYESFIGWKWKTLTGCEVETLTASEQLAAVNSGLNIYKYIRGKASTSGSLATKSAEGEAVHIDSTVAKDIIIMNVATALLEMFRTHEILTLGFKGKAEVEKAIRSALIYCGSLGLIEANEDNTYQFTVTVPDITAAMRQSRKLTGVKFSYVLATNMEQIEVDGLELMELIEGGNS